MDKYIIFGTTIIVVVFIICFTIMTLKEREQTGIEKERRFNVEMLEKGYYQVPDSNCNKPIWRKKGE